MENQDFILDLITAIASLGFCVAIIFIYHMLAKIQAEADTFVKAIDAEFLVTAGKIITHIEGKEGLKEVTDAYLDAYSSVKKDMNTPKPKERAGLLFYVTLSILFADFVFHLYTAFYPL